MSDELQTNIRLGKHHVSAIELLSPSNKTLAIKTGIDLLYKLPFCVFIVENSVNTRGLLSVARATEYFSKGFHATYLSNDDRLLNDIKQFGPAAFEFKMLGSFRTQLEALDYKDFLINRKLSAGSVLYNDETYTGITPRVFELPIEPSLLRKLTELSIIKKLKVSEILIKLSSKWVEKNSELLVSEPE